MSSISVKTSVSLSMLLKPRTAAVGAASDGVKHVRFQESGLPRLSIVYQLVTPQLDDFDHL